MMKKKFLIASLLLAASTFGAEETKWDFTGSNVEANIILSNSQKDAIYAGKDEDLILRSTVMHRDLSVKPSGIRYFYGLRFEQVDTKIEDKIINHVFLLMRKTRKL